MPFSIDPWLLVTGFLFSSVGLAYFTYGKKRSNLHLMTNGVVLMIYPYFTDSTMVAAGLGLALTATPFIFKWW